MKKWIKTASISCALLGFATIPVFSYIDSKSSSPSIKLPVKSQAENKNKVIIPEGAVPVSNHTAPGEKTAKKNPSYVTVNNKMFVGVTEVLRMSGFTEIKADSKTNAMTAVRNKAGKQLTFKHIIGTDTILLNGSPNRISEKSCVVDGKLYASFDLFQIISNMTRSKSVEQQRMDQEKDWIDDDGHDHHLEQAGEPGQTDGHAGEHNLAHAAEPVGKQK
ncbi:hypothetical protein [Aneurinibacillus tyrosinisolvens]|uniref:hypothetical protein n=1 Tax=Aneurinibacillus tyrosinisolvens TaxID=1443435 RepID=UPI00063F5CA5|nr:hypothetical protein [Aneurinibacillus tyrosinisolvens]